MKTGIVVEIKAVNHLRTCVFGTACIMELSDSGCAGGAERWKKRQHVFCAGV
jgi:hypothetical protein